MTGTVGETAAGAKQPIKIMANIFISFIGAGILGLPYVFKGVGVIKMGKTVWKLPRGGGESWAFRRCAN